MIIPFFIPHAGCPHQCVFCNQRNITGRNSAPDPGSLPSVIREHLANGSKSGPVEVAFYGGSFTALPMDLQEDYLQSVQPFLAGGAVQGIRISTRPDCITAPVLALLTRRQVGTVELGAQSLDDCVLERSGRGHTAADTADAAALLRNRGFRVGLQLMIGLPGDTPETFARTVAAAVALRPDFVRLYPVLVIRDTPLEQRYRSGSYVPLALDEAVNLCRGALDDFAQAGIPVIRAGLHAEEELEQPGTIIAGPWHPAFRQLVESVRLYAKMERLLGPVAEGSTVTFFVHPADLSTAVGQRKKNVRLIRDRYGVDARILGNAGVSRGNVTTELPCSTA